jgi:stalled ribosome rescue protein Dom34
MLVSSSNEEKYMTKTKKKRGYRRGYPVALLVSLEEHRAVLWRVFSKVVKQHLTVELGGRRKDKTLYNFHESIISALRPVLKEGVRSVIVTTPVKTTYAADFMNHVQRHHSYLLQSKHQNRTVFAELVDPTDQSHNVAELVKTKEFRKLIAETTSVEADRIVDMLDDCLFGTSSSSVVLYTLREIEDTVYNRKEQNNLKMSHLVLTDKFLTFSKEKDRVHRLLQISKNRKVKTNIVNAETSAGKRISQLGGIVFFATNTS